MPSANGRDFDSCLRFLRERWPTRRQVRVCTVPRVHPQDEWGLTWRRGDYWKISVARTTPQLAMDTLMHEWAHVLCGEENEAKGLPWDHKVHGDRWGVWHSRIYRSYYDES
jgi:hypothetical protein